MLPSVHADTIKPFASSSRQAIEQSHRSQAFILAFWSLDCLYCLDELSLLADVLRQHTRVKLILVSTDGQSSAKQIQQTLNKIKLPANVELWQYAESDEEKLRYSIDKQWYGELPRTYYYDSMHQVTAISGKPEQKWLHQWLNRL